MVDETDAEGADAGADPARVEALAERLREAGEPFVRATVVRREPPVSANVGDRAVVTADGIEGWVGGAACAQSVVRTESEAALADGRPRLVGLAPDPDDVARPGVEAYPMTCHSGGTLEVFLDPVVPAPSLVVVGTSPVARTLARLAGETAFDVTVAVPPGEALDRDLPTVDAGDPAAVADAATGTPYVAVASMGAADAEGVAAGLAAGARYVGLVASDRRAAEVVADAAERTGLSAEAVRDAITVPAGVDVGAETPAEIAVSVLAELVAVRRGDGGGVPADLAAPASEALGADEGDGAGDGHDHGADAVEPDRADATATDPVCGMDVDPAAAAATVDHAGTRYHFCSTGCAEAFADDPEGYR